MQIIAKILTIREYIYRNHLKREAWFHYAKTTPLFCYISLTVITLATCPFGQSTIYTTSFTGCSFKNSPHVE